MFPDTATGFPQQMDSRAFKVMIVAGEASGDLHGSYLVEAMKEMAPSISFYGIGGDKMQQAGVKLLANASDLAVMGLIEVFSRLKFILGVMGALRRSLQSERPDLVILIDYPGFNLPLAKAAKKKGIKVFYYISPKVWAWRKGRIKTIRRVVDQMALILPFEEELYRQAGVRATFVGHPLLDEIELTKTAAEIRNDLKMEPGIITVALLPGSREGEVRRLLPEMVQAARILANRFPSIQFVLPVAHTLPPELISGIIAQSGIDVRLVTGRTYEVLSISDVAIVASGTATLETALLVKPMVIVYKVSPLTYFLGKMVVRVKHMGLANIIAGRTVVPELMQKDFTPERVAHEVTLILENRNIQDRMIKDLLDIRTSLGEIGASHRAARLACDMLG
jgi:lipid-A-disaccharide synthase